MISDDSNCGIYQIINIITNKRYIGSSANLKERRSEHFRLLKNNCHSNKYLQRAYNKYGVINFKFEVIERYQNKILV